MRALRFVVAGVLVLGLTVAPGASAAPAARPAAGTTVSDVVVGFTFVLGAASLNAPDQALRIRTGDTVEWTNLDPVGHSISFEAMPKVLYLKQPGDKASMTFTKAGFYRYSCPEHPEPPGMQGLVFVTD
ncbi:MAG TPA: plastocyanin/azurin family copper-binding protein [Acidimicrobiia bacterium]|nr:plastocyanin/azurin family copper-binding protein [Acidimicrobiia bacterium]